LNDVAHLITHSDLLAHIGRALLHLDLTQVDCLLPMRSNPDAHVNFAILPFERMLTIPPLSACFIWGHRARLAAKLSWNNISENQIGIENDCKIKNIERKNKKGSKL